MCGHHRQADARQHLIGAELLGDSFGHDDRRTCHLSFVPSRVIDLFTA
jgi:hypothetical protein